MSKTISMQFQDKKKKTEIFGKVVKPQQRTSLIKRFKFVDSD